MVYTVAMRSLLGYGLPFFTFYFPLSVQSNGKVGFLC